jgi:3-hydroxyisobutyrate dehydrogenase
MTTSFLADETRIAVIGVGNMGFPIARHITAAFPHAVAVDKNLERVDLACKSGLEAFGDVAALSGRPLDVAVTSLDRPEILRELLLGPESILSRRVAAVTVIDVGTSGVELSVELHDRLRERGHIFVDCPVSGGRQGAENGTLTAMVGAAEGEYPIVAGVLGAFCSQIHYMGAPGRGAVIKLANNALAIGSLGLAGEVLAYAEAKGIERKLILDTIATGTGDSRMLRLKHEMLITRSYAQPNFEMLLALKDLRLTLTSAAANGLEMPLLRLTESLLNAISALHTEPLDVSVVSDPAIRSEAAAASRD